MPKVTSKISSKHFLIVGDPFLAEETVNALITQIQSNHSNNAQRTRYRLTETPIDQVLSEARNLPFLVEAQIFYLRDADTLKEMHLEVLELYLANPSPSAYLLFESEKVDRRSKFFKMMEKHGQVVTLDDQKKKSEGARFIREKLCAVGKTIHPSALARLNQQTGDAPIVLESIVNQLISYSGEVQEISLEMVEKCEEDWQQVDGFQLVNAIASKNTGESMIILKRLLEENSRDYFELLGLLHWQMRRIWLAKVLLEEGRSESLILKRCRISPKQAPYFMRQLRPFSVDVLEKAIEGLFQLDWKSKSGLAEGSLELEKWVVGVTS